MEINQINQTQINKQTTVQKANEGNITKNTKINGL